MKASSIIKVRASEDIRKRRNVEGKLQSPVPISLNHLRYLKFCPIQEKEKARFSHAHSKKHEQHRGYGN